MKLYGIRDKVAGCLAGQMMMFRHDAVAIRFYSDAAADKQTLISQHPGDFDLVAYGLYDDNRDVFEAYPEPRTIISGEQWLAAQGGGMQNA